MAEKGQSISAEKLCQLTGLTDRRHRQLAKEGYFPPPIESEYQLVPTLQGMFRFYREMSQGEKKGLNELKGIKLKREITLADQRIEKEAGRVVPFDSVNEFLLRVGSLQKIVLCQKLEKEMPPRAEGQPVANIIVLGRELADEVCEIFGQHLHEWTESNRPAGDEPISRLAGGLDEKG